MKLIIAKIEKENPKDRDSLETITVFEIDEWDIPRYLKDIKRRSLKEKGTYFFLQLETITFTCDCEDDLECSHKTISSEKGFTAYKGRYFRNAT